jgi:hypothetical protein
MLRPIRSVPGRIVPCTNPVLDEAGCRRSWLVVQMRLVSSCCASSGWQLQLAPSAWVTLLQWLTVQLRGGTGVVGFAPLGILRRAVAGQAPQNSTSVATAFSKSCRRRISPARAQPRSNRGDYRRDGGSDEASSPEQASWLISTCCDPRLDATPGGAAAARPRPPPPPSQPACGAAPPSSCWRSPAWGLQATATHKLPLIREFRRRRMNRARWLSLRRPTQLWVQAQMHNICSGTRPGLTRHPLHGASHNHLVGTPEDACTRSTCLPLSSR